MNATPFLLKKHDEEVKRTQPLLARVLTEEEISAVSGGFPTLVYTSNGESQEMELDEVTNDE